MQSERNEIEVAWAAGLFEGEGTWNAFVRDGRKVQIHASLAMTDFDVVERFARIVGFGNLVTHNSPSMISKGHKPLRKWQVQEAARVREVIELFMPYLGERRRAKALEVLELGQDVRSHSERTTHCPNGHPYDEENLRLETFERAHGKMYVARRCKICRREQSRDRARRRLGITPDRYRVDGVT